MNHLLPIAAFFCLIGTPLRGADFYITNPVKHFGACDGSDGVACGKDYFVGASDENNVLRLFGTADDSVGKPLLDLNEWLGTTPKTINGRITFEECDIEGAARIANRIYWIGSHGRTTNGNKRKERQVFFATDIHGESETAKLTFVGQPYTCLLDDLLADRELKRLNLAEAIGTLDKDPTRAPKEKGALNIESVCSEGNILLIGFRNPIPEDKALIVPLMNPARVVEDGERARLGKPILIDLGGLGIRDMVWWRDRFLIIAGDYRSDSDRDARASRLFLWKGDANPPEALNVSMRGLNPEGAIVFGEGSTARLLLLSDDGSLKIDGIEQKKLYDPRRFFRSVWLESSK